MCLYILGFSFKFQPSPRKDAKISLEYSIYIQIIYIFVLFLLINSAKIYLLLLTLIIQYSFAKISHNLSYI